MSIRPPAPRRIFAAFVWVTAGALAPALAPLSEASDEAKRSAGPRLTYSSRPSIPDPIKACSFRRPICVHATASAGQAILDVLASAEAAWDVATGALALPVPDLDPDSLSYDVYLANDSPSGTWLEARDVRSRVDRGRAFTVVDGRSKRGCMLDTAMTQSIVRASLFRASPATTEPTARAQSAALTHLAVPCALGRAADAAATFQSRAAGTPCEGGESAREAELFADGASLWWSRLDWAYGRVPGGLIAATWALSPTMTPLGAGRWNDEPDTFDVVRKSFEGRLSTGSGLADVALDVAVARAFFGSRDDGLHQPETRTLGDAALVPIDWDLPWPSSPRRVAPRAPVGPLGASYLVVERADAPHGSRLRVEIVWEEHSLFRWALVKIDDRGREMGRIVIPTKERATEAQMTFVDLDGASRLLLVGLNAGDPAYRFDPDEEVWEPHGWLVTIASE